MQQVPFTLQTLNLDAVHGKFAIEPLTQGFGDTLGNSLRRVLYTSIKGAAITSVAVTGASHQFSTLTGVSEDVMQLILNLKQIRIAYSGDQSVNITLSAKGPGEVKAGDFETPANVKIINSDLVIAHLADKSAKIEISATIETGCGYSPAEDRKTNTVGVIAVDAIFTPVLRVNYAIESARVGRVTDYDKLVLDITTDGSVSPEAALKSASQTLADYFSTLVDPATTSSSNNTNAAAATVSTGSSMAIEELDLPTRIANSLQKAGFATVNDLLATTKAELAKVKNLGAKSAQIIDEALTARGITLA